MYENDACSCEAKMMPVKETKGTLCGTAADLLGCLRHIDVMVAQIEKVLFNDDRNEQSKPCEPDCLDSNVVIAFDAAKNIARHLENILGKL
jgi:hypothetical protein